MRVGFAGLGRMGGAMAARVLGAGHEVAVFDVAEGAMASLATRGATRCASLADLARRSEVLVTSLPGPDDVMRAFTQDDGLLAGAARGTIVVETSTLGPEHARELAALCGRAGVRYLDAPVSNGVEGALAGDLTMMIGGDATDVEEARQVLDAMCSRLYVLGPVGAGSAAKAMNQMIYLGYVAAFCESLRLGEAWGMDIPTLVDVLRHSVAGTPLRTGWESRLETGERTPGFPLHRVLKDLALAADACAEKGYRAPIFEAARDAFSRAAEAGALDQDLTAVFDSPRREPN